MKIIVYQYCKVFQVGDRLYPVKRVMKPKDEIKKQLTDFQLKLKGISIKNGNMDLNPGFNTDIRPKLIMGQTVDDDYWVIMVDGNPLPRQWSQANRDQCFAICEQIFEKAIQPEGKTKMNTFINTLT